MTITSAYRAAHDATEAKIERVQGVAAALDMMIQEHEALMQRAPMNRAIRGLSEVLVEAIDDLLLLHDADWNAAHMGAANESPVMGLYRAWEAAGAQVAAEAKADEMGPAVTEAFTKLSGVHNALLATPSTCPADFVAKVSALTSFGEIALPTQSACPALWAEARAFIQ
jgi:hypothetical protein